MHRMRTHPGPRPCQPGAAPSRKLHKTCSRRHAGVTTVARHPLLRTSTSSRPSASRGPARRGGLDRRSAYARFRQQLRKRERRRRDRWSSRASAAAAQDARSLSCQWRRRLPDAHRRRDVADPVGDRRNHGPRRPGRAQRSFSLAARNTSPESVAPEPCGARSDALPRRGACMFEKRHPLAVPGRARRASARGQGAVAGRRPHRVLAARLERASTRDSATVACVHTTGARGCAR